MNAWRDVTGWCGVRSVGFTPSDRSVTALASNPASPAPSLLRRRLNPARAHKPAHWLRPFDHRRRCATAQVSGKTARPACRPRQAGQTAPAPSSNRPRGRVSPARARPLPRTAGLYAGSTQRGSSTAVQQFSEPPVPLEVPLPAHGLAPGSGNAPRTAASIPGPGSIWPRCRRYGP